MAFLDNARAALALLAALGLAGCGASAPSESDVRSALMDYFRPDGSKADSEQFKKEAAGIKLIGCAKATEKGGFNCDFSGVAGMASGRFVKGDKGWQLMVP